MSNCSTQAYASFQLSDASLTQDQLLAFLQDTIKAEALSESFDAETAYGPLADAFDYDDAFDALQDEETELSDQVRLTLNDGFLDLEGVPLLNEDDHLTRWVAWVLFRQFGQGDVLTFSTETIWNDGTSGCTYEVSRTGSVKAKTYFVKTEED